MDRAVQFRSRLIARKSACLFGVWSACFKTQVQKSMAGSTKKLRRQNQNGYWVEGGHRALVGRYGVFD